LEVRHLITVQWNPPIEQLMERHAGKMPAVVRDVLIRLGVMGESYMREITPVDSSNLRKRISWEIPGRPEVHIGANATYAPYILTDAEPFTITAKNKKWLAWVDKGKTRPSTAEGWKQAREDGIAHYAKSVRHPGGVNALGKTETYLDGRIPSVVASILNKYGIVG